ncbi:hypothetical protein GLOTRDRAFT_101372 [Gloeophyllum trabeum ATCC 11539]|uniref:Uncharacterized protein n=1 Tax=Gloeophyllum trabeum (strain ATCC 11539 / FP-39264 / Madison 617) TaxID=670483 RepID=S7PWB6_GLOTA|nr:uncharacterized protein GLOTRDRAFT_101372 [Gloeophyllum trabeum ATCC 11539]EPQ51916.1 hypothetical protein GLOTRDRAFT_101372 [Gloeophyllum trabeum ATCC 11539]
MALTQPPPSPCTSTLAGTFSLIPAIPRLRRTPGLPQSLLTTPHESQSYLGWSESEMLAA